MDGWDGWGSPIGEIAEPAEIAESAGFNGRRKQVSLDIGHLGYALGRPDHDDDVSRDLAAVLSRGDALDSWPGWPATGWMPRRKMPHDDRTH